jgi:hypothetical protein
MRQALIVWGGWEGHEPEAGARAVKAMLEEEGFAVRVENTTAVFADPAIAELSLIVPIYTMSKLTKAEEANLTKAVENGVGLGGMEAWAMPFANRPIISSCAAGNGSRIRATSSTIM